MTSSHRYLLGLSTGKNEHKVGFILSLLSIFIQNLFLELSQLSSRFSVSTPLNYVELSGSHTTLTTASVCTQLHYANVLIQVGMRVNSKLPKGRTYSSSH